MHAGEIEREVEPADLVQGDFHRGFHSGGQMRECCGECSLGGFLTEAQQLRCGLALAGDGLMKAGAKRDLSWQLRAGDAPDDGVMTAIGMRFDGDMQRFESRSRMNAQESRKAATARLQAGLAEFAWKFQRACQLVDLEQSRDVIRCAMRLADERKLEMRERGHDVMPEEFDERGLVAHAAGLREVLEPEGMRVAAGRKRRVVRLEEKREPGGEGVNGGGHARRDGKPPCGW